MPERDYYELLGVPRTATADQVKRAYRKLAKQYHPDRNPNDKTAEARFKEIHRAYEVLSDAQKRKMYDQFGHAGVGGGAPPGGWAAGPGGRRVYTWSSAGGPDIPIEDLDDLFSVFAGPGHSSAGGFTDRVGDSVFDQFFGRAAQRRGGARQARPEDAGAGRNLEYTITLTFDQAVRGTTLEISVPSAAWHSPAGKVKVKIPAGVAHGQRIRIRGKGRPGTHGSLPGDLYILCQVEPHPYFRRLGNDIYLNLPLSVTEAALGAKVEIPTLDGKTVLTIPPGTPSGAKLRLKNKGVQPAGNQPRGDQYAVVRIVPPKSPTPRQRELLEQLQNAGEDSPRKDLGW